METKHILWAVLVAAIWGVNFTVIRLGLDDFPPILLNGLRFAVAGGLFAWFIPRPQIPVARIIAIGLTLGVAKFTLLFVGMDAGMPAGLSSLVLQAQAFFTVLFAAVLLDERPKAAQLTGMAVAFAGLGVIAMDLGQGAVITAFVIVLAASACWGLANIQIKRSGANDMLGLMVWASLAAALPLFALSWVFEGHDRILGALTLLSVKGIGAACIALDFPVVSGNVSLYNETNGEGILPTPTIGGVGLMADVHKRASVAFGKEGQDIIVIGETLGHLGQSLYLREIEGREEGAPPPVDLAFERRNGDFVRALIEAGELTTCHDISGGGLGVALAEMAMASNIGATIDVPASAPALHGWLFGEDQARYIIATDNAEDVLARAASAGVSAEKIGQTGGKQLTVGGQATISIEELAAGHQSWLPDFMSQP